MAGKEISTYTLYMVAGDTEFVRFNLKDANGDIIDVSNGRTLVMGIKRKTLDTTFLIPEKTATTYVYNELTQPYTVEFEFSSDETVDILNYEGKVRGSLLCKYDVEMHDTYLGEDDITTVLQGDLDIKRSIAGRVV